MILFESQSEFYRNPQGALKEDEEITLKIYVKGNTLLKPIIKIEKRQDYDSIFYKDYQMEWLSKENENDLYEITFSIKEKGHYYYYFEINDEFTKKFELLVYDKNYQTPSWIKGGIIYHIFVDRFHKTKILSKKEDIILRDDWEGIPNYLPDKDGEIKNNDFFGGNIEGIVEKLPYINSLGVNVIYLSPIFDAYSNHKYDTGDYLSIDSMFGTEDTLKKLCSEAKNLGINIILDGVFSHTGDDSIYFNKYGKYNSLGAYQSTDSIYYDWYFFKSFNDDYECWWNIKTLPTLNKKNTSYIEFITGKNKILNYWQNKGVKGWRLDVADELPNEFLEKIRCSVKDNDEEAYLVGEVWEDASNKFSYDTLKEYFCGKQLDSVTNYPLKNAIINYVRHKDCQLLHETMNFIIEKYPPQTVNCLMNILGTHDTARILTELGCKKTPSSKEEKAHYKLNALELNNAIKLLKIASLLQFTLPGVPCIYYGDEIGMQGFEDPFNRGCFLWDNINHEIFSHYKFLSELRKNSIFKEGKYKNYVHDKEVFVYERSYDNKRIIIAINLSDKAIKLSFKNYMIEYKSNEKKDSFEINKNSYLIVLSL